MIKDMPKERRPRELLIKYGAESLSNEELLAILLRSGYKNHSAVDLAIDVLNLIPNINQLSEVTLTELKNIKGIKDQKATLLIALFELCKRVNQGKRNGIKVTNAKEAFNLVNKEYLNAKKERLEVLYLDSRLILIDRMVLSLGSLEYVIISANEILKHALKLNAKAMVLIHNHPSGDFRPSRDDLQNTQDLINKASLFEILLLDHLIISNNEYYSFQENHIL